MRIAWFSPLNNTLVRSALATEVLLGAAPSNWDVELFVDDFEWSQVAEEGRSSSEKTWNGRRVFHYLNCYRRERENPFDIYLYHLEDHARSAFVQLCQGGVPGITIFHDLTLSRFDRQTPGTSAELSDINSPFCDRELKQAGVIVVENTRAKQEVLSRGIGAPVELSSPVVTSVNSEEKARLQRQVRSELNISEKLSVIGFAGQNLLEERVMHTLEAMGSLLDSRPEITLLWAVEDEADSRSVLSRVATRFPKLKERTILCQYSSHAELVRILAGANIYVGVRYDALRGASLATLTALRLGIPSIVAHYGSSLEFPKDVVLGVEVGRGEVKRIAAAIEECLRDSSLCSVLGARAVAYVEDVLSAQSVICDLESIIGQHCEYLRVAKGQYLSKLMVARDNLESHALELR